MSLFLFPLHLRKSLSLYLSLSVLPQLFHSPALLPLVMGPVGVVEGLLGRLGAGGRGGAMGAAKARGHHQTVAPRARLRH